MREYLFRGKRKDNGEWVYGNFVRGCVDDFAYIVEFGNKELCRNYVEVIPETVGQYTGLTDKNGKKIFEGDICKHRSNYSGNTLISLVTYTDGHFLALVSENSGFELSEKLEVIGNIHDNPELLKWVTRMTPEEAIGIVRCAIGEVEWNYPLDYAEAFEVVIEALEKQVAKKPREAVQLGFFWYPACSKAIKMRIEGSKINISYCPFCGQALDWRETE